ncbi:hypothetical protein ACIBKZ_09800 [Streptomyces sp. NPDC050421]|uniref:hypothetical protein n=1 Tax=Streptomyces sp. NPDC050421 TaxID=3365613 RepID=UPI0037955ABD
MFPEQPLGLRGELQIGGSWVDVTRHIYTRDPVRTVAGMSAQGTGVDPSSLALTLNNRDGLYSPRNPLSPYFGQLGRNTPIRITVPGVETHLGLGPGSGAVARTPSTGLPTGDLDLRIEATADAWSTPGKTYELISRWQQSGAQQSFIFVLSPSGYAGLWWSPDGISLRSAFGEPLGLIAGERAALRVTLDVNDGAGGAAVTFYRASSIAGPWQQVGSPVVSAGTTSLYASSAPLEVGDVPVDAFSQMPGAVHAVEVRNGINGTAVVRADFSTATPDAATFTDITARVWTVAGDAAFTDRAALFCGEIASWPSRWAASGRDVWVPIEAAGVLRRMQQGRKALSSTLRRRIPSGKPVAYWPLEDGDTATQAYSPIPGVQPLRATLLDFAAADSLPGSDPLPTVTAGATIAGTVPAYPPSGAWQFEFAYRLSAEPSVMTPVLNFVTRSTVWPRLTLEFGPAGGVRLTGTNVDNDATTLFVNGVAQYAGQWTRIRLQAEQSGADVKLTLLIVPIGGSGGQWVKTYAGTVGPLRSFSADFSSGFDGMSLGHIAVFPSANVQVFNFADHGYNNETAADRAARLGAEEGLPVITTGDAATTAAMGPQTSQTLMDLLHECAEADGGILMEQSRALGLAYRPRTSLYNQEPRLVLDYAAGHLAPPLEPVEDDQTVRNDVTVTRVGGGSGRTVVESGPLSTLPPEQGGVGIYDESTDLNLATDEQAGPMAAWLAHLGTWDEPRFPSIRVQLHNHPELIRDTLGLRIGDLVRITNLPPWVGAPTMDIHVMQIQHEPRPRAWALTLVGTPAGPYRVGVVGDGARADTSGSELAAPVLPTATTLPVVTTVGRQWVTTDVYAGEFPFDVQLGGEQVTVTAITGTSAYDRFTRSEVATWGTSDSGQTWIEAGGPASNRAINGSAGTLTLTATSSTWRIQRLGLTTLTDVEILATMSVNQTATGDALSPSILLRQESDTDFYVVRCYFFTDGLVYLSLYTTGQGTIGAITASPYAYTPGAQFRVRARIDGQRVRARVWPAAGTEPNTWLIDRTPTTGTNAAGDVGILAYAAAGNTNTNPVISVSDFALVQQMTVTRSVNGISKSHAAGTDVRLAHPTIAAL